MDDRRLPIFDELLDNEGDLKPFDFCAPIFIASAFSGTLLARDEQLVFTKFDDRSIRSGTVTFIKYKGECIALTCKHVADALVQKRENWKAEQPKKYGSAPMAGFHFFTPRGNDQFHFNYDFWPVRPDDSGRQPDVALARVNEASIRRLGRTPLTFTRKASLPQTGVAAGYPEEQRDIRAGQHVNVFSPRFTACIASLQTTARGDLLLQDAIQDPKGLNNLSGMSGGPIVWADGKSYGLAGIVYEGRDVQSRPAGGISAEHQIWIHGERLTGETLASWLALAPPLSPLQDGSKSLFVPPQMRE